MSDDSHESTELRRAVQLAVMNICGAEEESESRMTGPAIQALAELTFLYATSSLAFDLDAFSTHANRRTITVDDVKLAIRKNQSLKKKLDFFGEGQCGTKAVSRRSSILRENKNARNCNGLSSSDEDAKLGENNPRSSTAKEDNARKARPLGSSDDDSDSGQRNPGKGVLKENVARRSHPLDTSDDDSDLGKSSARKEPKPGSSIIQSRKRDRSASKRMAIQNDSSTDESDAQNASKEHKRKTFPIVAIHLDDSSTSSEESEANVQKKSNLHLTKALTSLSFSDEE